jgi:hypothetical protein
VGFVVISIFDPGMLSVSFKYGESVEWGRSHFDFWRAITFWIFADMMSVCTVSSL